MAMGKTGTVNITPEMLRSALNVIETYQTTTGNLYTQLKDTVGNLIPSNFSGNAADGFKFFYEQRIEPAVGENLTNLIKVLQQIIEETLKAIPDTDGLDDQLAEGNRQ